MGLDEGLQTVEEPQHSEIERMLGIVGGVEFGAGGVADPNRGGIPVGGEDASERGSELLPSLPVGQAGLGLGAKVSMAARAARQGRYGVQ